MTLGKISVTTLGDIQIRLSIINREVLHARQANPPAVPPVDALQLCIEAAGKDKIISEDEIVAHEFIFILAG